jgi:hypothetical protein
VFPQVLTNHERGGGAFACGRCGLFGAARATVTAAKTPDKLVSRLRFVDKARLSLNRFWQPFRVGTLANEK